jgi:hypothetical protein
MVLAGCSGGAAPRSDSGMPAASPSSGVPATSPSGAVPAANLSSSQSGKNVETCGLFTLEEVQRIMDSPVTKLEPFGSICKVLKDNLIVLSVDVRPYQENRSVEEWVTYLAENISATAKFVSHPAIGDQAVWVVTEYKGRESGPSMYILKGNYSVWLFTVDNPDQNKQAQLEELAKLALTRLP